MWWAIIRTPDGTSLWPVGDEVDNRLVLAARVLTGFPTDDSWVDGGTGYDLAISEGEPHDTLIAAVKRVGTRDELSKVLASDMDAHAAAMLQATKTRQIEGAKQALAALDQTARAQVIAEVAEIPVEGVADVRPLA